MNLDIYFRIICPYLRSVCHYFPVSSLEIRAILKYIFWLNLYVSTFLNANKLFAICIFQHYLFLKAVHVKHSTMFRKLILLPATCFSRRLIFLPISFLRVLTILFLHDPPLFSCWTHCPLFCWVWRGLNSRTLSVKPTLVGLSLSACNTVDCTWPPSSPQPAPAASSLLWNSTPAHCWGSAVQKAFLAGNLSLVMTLGISLLHGSSWWPHLHLVKPPIILLYLLPAHSGVPAQCCVLSVCVGSSKLLPVPVSYNAGNKAQHPCGWLPLFLWLFENYIISLSKLY